MSCKTRDQQCFYVDAPPREELLPRNVATPIMLSRISSLAPLARSRLECDVLAQKDHP